MKVTVRLFEGVHKALVDELGRTSPGLRASRAVYLMTLGLMHEHAQSGAGVAAVPRPGPEPKAKGRTLTPEDRAFVTDVLEFGAEGP